jgi:hypothetical protein
MTRHSVFSLALLVAAAVALVAGRAQAVDRNFAGSVQLDYHLVPTEGGNLNAGNKPGQYGFDGFTLEASEKLAVDVSDHVSANVKVCFGCHGFELDMTYMDFRVVDELNVRVGRFSPAFGSFNLRHDVANHKLSDKPLPYDMGRMLRLRAWNLGVLPSPFPDTGIEVDGTHWFGDSAQLDYAAYAVQGFRSADPHPLDIDFIQSRQLYYVDNNARPTVGARVALTTKLDALSDFTVGASGMYGTYDINNTLSYAILGADFVLRIVRTNFRVEYLVRRTEFDTSDPARLALTVAPTNGNFFVKHGAYVEVEQPLSPRVDLIGRVDGMLRVGNFAADPTGETPLSARSSVVRYTLGTTYAFERGFRLKTSTELWQFSDADDSGRKIDVGIHVAFVGTY